MKKEYNIKDKVWIHIGERKLVEGRVVEIITLAYNNTSFNNIVDEAGYNEEETATIIYDHFINKGNKKYKDEDLVMKAMPDPDSD